MDVEINSISHVWTAVEIANGLGSQHTVGVSDHLVVISQENGC